MLIELCLFQLYITRESYHVTGAESLVGESSDEIAEVKGRAGDVTVGRAKAGGGGVSSS